MKIIPFNFSTSIVRTQVGEDGTPWFLANDVCAALKFGNPRQAIDSHVDADDVRTLDTLTDGGVQKVNYVNESGMYALTFGSTKETAKQFKKWLTSEVLPSLRKHGFYGDVPRKDAISLRAMSIKILEKLDRAKDAFVRESLELNLRKIHEELGETLPERRLSESGFEVTQSYFDEIEQKIIEQKILARIDKNHGETLGVLVNRLKRFSRENLSNVLEKLVDEGRLMAIDSVKGNQKVRTFYGA